MMLLELTGVLHYIAGLGWPLLWAGAAENPSIWQITAVHLLASAAVASVFWRSLPPSLCRQRTACLAFGFSVACCLPVFGSIGLLVCIAPGLRRSAKVVASPIVSLHCRSVEAPPVIRAPANNDRRMAPQAVSAGPVIDTAELQRAVIATLLLDARRAAQLLRRAMKGDDDEVRLLAYALLQRREREIEVRIHQAITALAYAAPQQAAPLHGQVAVEFWELASLLPDTDIGARSLYARAQEHATRGLSLTPGDGALHFLQGRIALRLRDPDTAKDALEAALASGVPVGRVLPYLAEASFRQANHAALMQSVDGWSKVDARPRVAASIRYWQEGGHAAEFT